MIQVRSTFLAARLPLLVGAVLAVSSPVRAEVSTLSAAQVVSKNVAARGGAAAWHAVHTLSFTGKMDAGRVHPPMGGSVDNASTSPPKRRVREMGKAGNGPATFGNASAAQGAVIALPYRMEMKRPRKVRIELDFGGQTAVQVYDGAAGWTTRPYLGYTTPQPFSPEELKLASDQQELDGLLIDAAAKGSQVAMEGVEPVDGRRAYKLRVKLKNGDVRHVWVDAKSFLEVKVDGARQIGTRTRAMSTVLRDYRKVDGVMIPFVMETTGAGTVTAQKIVIEKATVNANLPDARFTKPAGTGAAS